MKNEIMKNEFMKNELIETPKEIQEFQNKQNLEHMISKVKVIKSELLDEILSCGILASVAEKILNGERVVNCPKCKTPNMYMSPQNFEDDFGLHKYIELYKCDNCNEVNLRC